MSIKKIGIIILFLLFLQVVLPKSISTLITELSSKDKDVRYKAARQLGKTGDPKAIPYLIKALDDEYKYVRYWAASSLGELKAREAVDKLIELLKSEDKTMRYWAAVALGEIGEGKAIPYLEEALRLEKEEETRLGIKIALEDLKKTVAGPLPAVTAVTPRETTPALPTSTPQIIVLEPTPTPTVVIPASVEEAISGLGDQNPAIRKASAFSLGKLEARESIKYLLEAIPAETDQEVLKEIIIALGRLKAKEAIETFTSIFPGAPLAIKQAILDSATQISTPQARTLVRDALNSPIDKVREKALNCLGYFPREKEDLPLIRKLTEEENADIVISAIGILGDWEDKESVDRLIYLLANENKDIVTASAFALGKIKDSKATEPLIQALSDKDEKVRAASAFALGQIQDPQAIPSLCNALFDKYWNVRYWAVTALGNFGDPQTIEPLLKAYQTETDEDIKRIIVETINQLKNKIKG